MNRVALVLHIEILCDSVRLAGACKPQQYSSSLMNHRDFCCMFLHSDAYHARRVYAPAAVQKFLLRYPHDNAMGNTCHFACFPYSAIGLKGFRFHIKQALALLVNQLAHCPQRPTS